MTSRHIRLPYLLLATSVACGLALLAAVEASSNAETRTAGANGDMVHAADASAPLPKQSRRRHGAMSMPYFSFARSLRPGS